jgi:hypothetical protein
MSSLAVRPRSSSFSPRANDVPQLRQEALRQGGSIGKGGRGPSSYTLEDAANAGVLTGVVGAWIVAAAEGRRTPARRGIVHFGRGSLSFFRELS